MKKTLDNIFDKLTYYLCLFAGILFCLIVIVLLANIILRSAFNSGIMGQYEIVQYGIMICIGLGMARTAVTHRHIHVNLITSHFGWRLRSFVLFLGRILCTATYAFAAYLFIAKINDATKYFKVTDLYHIPFQYIYWIFLALLALSALVFLYQTIVYFAGIFVNYDEEAPKPAAAETVDVTE